MCSKSKRTCGQELGTLSREQVGNTLLFFLLSEVSNVYYFQHSGLVLTIDYTVYLIHVMP